MAFTEADVPNLAGQIAIVTGANSGIGLEAARMLAEKGADVVLACRNVSKAENAIAAIRERARAAKVRAFPLDLANLASVRQFAAAMKTELPRVDLLINNAGIMAVPRAATSDGFEMQIGTNHLGHFALTGLLLDWLERSGAGRVVTVASGVHHYGRIDFGDLMGERRYDKWRAYCQSKLANLLFMYELDRRLRRASSKVLSVGAHPGYAATNLQYVGPSLTKSSFGRVVMQIGNTVFAQSAASGALPTVRAATDPEARGANYYGPSGLGELRGSPVLVRSSRRARDEATASRLWSVSEALTGADWSALASAAA
jgi:NAD(P)-dependent dehydrogenase (short-subunit alcohol dehydrogenase family)